MNLPTELAEIFRKHFSFPEKPLFGAVATVHDGQPRIRTMRIYDVNEVGCLILLTHTGSNKWKEFEIKPHVSINIVSENKLIQVIVSGQLQLHTPKTAYEMAKLYWSLVRPDVKKIYDPKYKAGKAYCASDALTILEEAPYTFGIACVVPIFWETLHLESDYPLSHRYQFYLENGSWQKHRIHAG